MKFLGMIIIMGAVFMGITLKALSDDSFGYQKETSTDVNVIRKNGSNLFKVTPPHLRNDIDVTGMIQLEEEKETAQNSTSKNVFLRF